MWVFCTSDLQVAWLKILLLMSMEPEIIFDVSILMLIENNHTFIKIHDGCGSKNAIKRCLLSDTKFNNKT